MAFDWLIRGGTVVDGTGAPGRQANVALTGDRVTAITPALAGEAAQIVDAAGCIVAPGFIDMPAHSDFALLACPSAEVKVHQGVTTEVTGMCGFSPAPSPLGGGLLREWAWKRGAVTPARRAASCHLPAKRRPTGSTPRHSSAVVRSIRMDHP